MTRPAAPYGVRIARRERGHVRPLVDAWTGARPLPGPRRGMAPWQRLAVAVPLVCLALVAALECLAVAALLVLSA